MGDRSTLWWLLLLLLLTSNAPSSRAQEFPPRPASDFLDMRQGMTEADFVARALASNPTLAAQRRQIEIAAGEVTQAGLRKNPSLTIGGLKEVPGADNRINVSGSLPLELFGRRGHRTEVARGKEDATQQSVSDDERLLTAQVRSRFGAALAALRELSFVEQLLEVNQSFLKLMDERVHAGAIPSLDAEETRVEVNRIASLRIDDQAKAEDALLALKQAAGMEPEEAVRLKGELEIPGAAYDEAALLQSAVAHRPDLAFQKANEALANAELQQARAQGRLDANVYGGYERPSSGFAQQAFDSAGVLRPIRQTFNYAVFGLDISLPLFNRNQGTVQADTAAIQAARSQVAAADLALRHEVAQSLLRYNGAQARVALYRAGVRDQAARNLDVLRQSFSYGRSTLLEVLTEQRRYLDIETEYVDILRSAYAARVALEQAVGTTLP